MSKVERALSSANASHVKIEDILLILYESLVASEGMKIPAALPLSGLTAICIKYCNSIVIEKEIKLNLK